MKYTVKCEYYDYAGDKEWDLQEIDAVSEEEAKEIMAEYLNCECWVDDDNIISIKVIEPKKDKIATNNYFSLYDFVEDWASANDYGYDITQQKDKIQITLYKITLKRGK